LTKKTKLILFSAKAELVFIVSLDGQSFGACHWKINPLTLKW